MIELELSNGLACLVDDDVPDEVLNTPWHAHWGKRTYYARANIAETRMLLHVYLMRPPPGLMVDHIDGNGWNNTRANLRVVTPSVNAANTHAGKPTWYKRGEIIPLRGVIQQRGKWSYFHEPSQRWLGKYDHAFAAAMLYDEFAESPNFKTNVPVRRFHVPQEIAPLWCRENSQ